MALRVSELAAQAGISPDTVRYYGRLGLLPETGRTAAGHRYYDDGALDRVRFIKGAQWFELRLEEIRQLLEVFDGDMCPCGPTRDLVRRRIAAIDDQRARLDEMRSRLVRLLGEDQTTTEEDMAMTDTLQVSPATTEATAEDDLGCGCCTRPPSAAAERIAELEARREAVERRLQGLSGMRI